VVCREGSFLPAAESVPSWAWPFSGLVMRLLVRTGEPPRASRQCRIGPGGGDCEDGERELGTGQEAGHGDSPCQVGGGISAALTNQQPLTSRDQCGIFIGLCRPDMGEAARTHSTPPRRQQ
jgi:hypothetical protein